MWQKICSQATFDIFAERDEAVHAAHQKLFRSAYSVDSLKDLQVYIDATILNFMSRLEDQVDTVIDLGYWLRLFSYGLFLLKVLVIPGLTTSLCCF